MKIDRKDFPQLREIDGAKVVMFANADILKKSGMGNGATTRFAEGDIIEFPDEVVLSTVQIRGNANRTTNLVGVKRNGVPAWVYATSFRRMDASGKAVGEVCEHNLRNYPGNDYGMIESMLNKTLKCYAVQEIEVNNFNDAGTIEGTRKQTVGLLAFGDK